MLSQSSILSSFFFSFNTFSLNNWTKLTDTNTDEVEIYKSTPNPFPLFYVDMLKYLFFYFIF